MLCFERLPQRNIRSRKGVFICRIQNSMIMVFDLSQPIRSKHSIPLESPNGRGETCQSAAFSYCVMCTTEQP